MRIGLRRSSKVKRIKTKTALSGLIVQASFEVVRLLRGEYEPEVDEQTQVDLCYLLEAIVDRAKHLERCFGCPLCEAPDV